MGASRPRPGKKGMVRKAPDLEPLIAAIHDRTPVSGLTHCFYRYPARFSPKFARAAIETFTERGELVYDPFMGGGTTLVEAMALSRKAIGTDLNSLAYFVAKTKTTLLTDGDISAVRSWIKRVPENLKLTRNPERPTDWIEEGYQKNFSNRTTWPIRKTIELALDDLTSLKGKERQAFVRCLLLKTAQWAVDCRKTHPSAARFRQQLVQNSEEMITGALELRHVSRESRESQAKPSNLLPECFHMPVQELAQRRGSALPRTPKLILTSPPYPGVHVLYHRWQLNGRKESPAPYWIADCLDGNGASFYTFGDRRQPSLGKYFDSMRECYKALSAVAGKGTWLVQLVAFSAPEWQLPLFLGILDDCGFSEIRMGHTSNATDGRSWRAVPNRKFYADHKGMTSSSKEVLLVHRMT